MRARDVFRIGLSTLCGAIAFAALPLSFQALWILSIANADPSTLIGATFFFFDVGALIGLTVALTKMRPLRAGLFGCVVAFVLALSIVMVQWSEINGSVHLVANIVYYLVPGFCSGVAGGAVNCKLA